MKTVSCADVTAVISANVKQMASCVSFIELVPMWLLMGWIFGDAFCQQARLDNDGVASRMPHCAKLHRGIPRPALEIADLIGYVTNYGQLLQPENSSLVVSTRRLTRLIRAEPPGWLRNLAQ